jgi:hypothetical protein
VVALWMSERESWFTETTFLNGLSEIGIVKLLVNEN